MQNRTIVLALGALAVLAAALVLLVPEARQTASVAASQTGDFLGAQYTLRGWQLALILLAFLPTLGRGLRRLVDMWAGGRQRYRQDHFLGLRWRWRYRHGAPTGIWCYCPGDDTQLIYNYSQVDNEVTFHCETCGKRYGSFAGDYSYVRGLIRRQIDRKLRTGEWRQESAAG
ncbi:MAG TPA: hypothetical protein VFA86_09600 [Gammaproteobacteria bacterium]|nr:hypothetical protein [Gammaproteobacteria bacterium]